MPIILFCSSACGVNDAPEEDGVHHELGAPEPEAPKVGVVADVYHSARAEGVYDYGGAVFDGGFIFAADITALERVGPVVERGGIGVFAFFHKHFVGLE